MRPPLLKEVINSVRDDGTVLELLDFLGLDIATYYGMNAFTEPNAFLS